MNDKPSHCDAHADAISLLAADCLSAHEEHELRQHLGTCECCRERFEQASIVCDTLRIARPPANTFDVSALVARTMEQVANDAAGSVTAVRGDRESIRSRNADSLKRWRLMGVAVLAVTVVCGVIWRAAVFNAMPDRSEVVHLELPDGKSVVKEQSQDEATQHRPTLMELRRAAAQSDEAFETLLAQGSSAMFAEPLDSRFLWQESLR